MLNKNRPTPPNALRLGFPMPSRYRTGAMSPSLTPITGSSTYSRRQSDDVSSAFHDEPDSFELEFKIVEDQGDYIFSADSPFQSSSPERTSWPYAHQGPRTPELIHSRRRTESESSYDGDSPCSYPCTPSTGISSGCDSPTIPGTKAHSSHFADFSDTRSLSHTNIEGSMTKGVFELPKVPSLERNRSLLSPITIVLDTIQEHNILESSPSSPSPSPRRSPHRSRTLPQIRPLPAIDLFNGSLPCSPAACTSGPLSPEDVCLSHALPITARPPGVRPPRGNSQVKLDKLLGRTDKSPKASSAFDSLPFTYNAKEQRVARMYDMI